MNYSIRADRTPKTIVPSTLRLGGENPRGDRIRFTNYYMELNGEPFFAVCGEFHYSRYPESGWELELRKMKMSGINVVAFYIFWNHHEELEGEFDWTGNRNLRRFIELCADNGLYAIVRVGPFCHGEVRNGGLPDWLFGRTFEVRSNDEGYMRYVRRLYGEIGRQASGLMFKDGGPVIGVQLENEFNAAAALWEATAKQGDEYLSGGSGGAEHIRLLKRYAMEAGLIAPIYTSTGWGNAPVLEDEVLPLYGGYAYTPWTVTAESPRQRPTGEYVFESYHDDGEEGGAFQPSYSKEKYPFACCEMGGGMQTWYLSRFQVEPESVAAMAVMKLAGGCNFLGYYMYHGGTNPVGRTGYLNESTTPRITYDFQAPLGEFGQVRASDGELRPLHYFLRRFGRLLAPMGTALPDGGLRATDPEDAKTLRYAIRSDGRSGFVFVNNYQDHVEMEEHRDVRFTIEGLQDGALTFPRGKGLTVRSKASMLLPFNFPLDGLVLRHATAQPITALESDSSIAYFFKLAPGADGEFVFGGEGIEAVTAEAGAGVAAVGPDREAGVAEACPAGTMVSEADGQGRRDRQQFTVSVPHDRLSLIRIRRRGEREIRIFALPAEEASKLWEAEIGGRMRLFLSDVPVVATGDGIELVSFGRNVFSFREYAGDLDPDRAEGWEQAAPGVTVTAHTNDRPDDWSNAATSIVSNGGTSVVSNAGSSIAPQAFASVDPRPGTTSAESYDTTSVGPILDTSVESHAAANVGACLGGQARPADDSLAVPFDGLFRAYTVKVPEARIPIGMTRPREGKLVLHIAVEALDRAPEAILSIDYTGNVGYAFSGGRLIHDHFYNGAPWEIGLARFRDRLSGGELVLETTPLRHGSLTFAADAKMAVERRFDGEETAIIRDVRIDPVYRAACSLKRRTDR